MSLEQLAFETGYLSSALTEVRAHISTACADIAAHLAVNDEADQ